MVNEQIQLTDEMLQFLYNSDFFQSFSEEEQNSFLKNFQHNEDFIEALSVATSVSTMIDELEQSIPPASDELIDYFKQPRHSISTKATVNKNVIHYPFGEKVKEQGPLIVCLQRSESMKEMLNFCKGLILPLFDLCHRQKRDLIVVPFNQNHFVMRFNCYDFSCERFEQFIRLKTNGEAMMFPLLNSLQTIWENEEVNEQIEVMIVSDLEFKDFQLDCFENALVNLKSLGMSISCVALSEQSFSHQIFQQFDKVYFINE